MHKYSVHLGLRAAVVFGCVSGLAAQAAPQQPVRAVVIEIVECVVYPEDQPTRSVDCAAKARTVCNGATQCELPIGLALTDGRQIDSNARTWKKVRVRYRCDKAEHVNGPHTQDDHATMLLACAGGF
jgi:hypothetical protein